MELLIDTVSLLPPSAAHTVYIYFIDSGPPPTMLIGGLRIKEKVCYVHCS